MQSINPCFQSAKATPGAKHPQYHKAAATSRHRQGLQTDVHGLLTPKLCSPCNPKAHSAGRRSCDRSESLSLMEEPQFPRPEMKMLSSAFEGPLNTRIFL
jgi:hypothetical protein